MSESTTVPEAKQVAVTNENYGPISVHFLRVIADQNKIIIGKLSEMYGVLSKIAAVDLGDDNGHTK
jgi:hypothetical protein